MGSRSGASASPRANAGSKTANSAADKATAPKATEAVSAPVALPTPAQAAPVTITSSHPLVTVAEIQAAAAVVSTLHHGKRRVAHIAGRSAASLDELKRVVRGLAKIGRLHPDALAMLAESDADDARALLETADGARVGGSVRDAVRESVLADFAHSIDIADAEGENVGMVRDVYRSAWRTPDAVTGMAAETVAEVKQTASDAEDALSEDAADKPIDNAEATPLAVALNTASDGNEVAEGAETKSETVSSNAEQIEQSPQE